MSCVLSTALFTLSIDLDLNPLRLGRDQQKSLEAVTGRLVKLLDRHQIAGTWAVADPAMSAATEALLSSSTEHEIAILGDPTWVGHEAGRMRFGRELSRRITHGRMAGLKISTLALRETDLTDNLDLLVKHEITVVRGDFLPAKKRWFSRPVVRRAAALRFGLWDIPASLRLPGDSRWKLGGGGNRPGRRGIDLAIAQRGVFHLQIDALSLVERGAIAEHTLEQVLRHAALRRQEKSLEIATLATVGRRLTGDRAVAPARSILNPAA